MTSPTRTKPRNQAKNHQPHPNEGALKRAQSNLAPFFAAASFYPVVFIDAIVVKIRDGQVANRRVYTVPRNCRAARRSDLPRAAFR